jgi:hypothetical protein
MRPGVYTFFDLDQAARGICGIEDIALSVLATVIGHNPRSRRVLIDAGALALSKDQSAAEFRDGLGFGLVCHAGGTVPLPGLRVAELHQEHGLIACDGDGDGDGDGDDERRRAGHVRRAARGQPRAHPAAPRLHDRRALRPLPRRARQGTPAAGVQEVWDKARGWQAGA